MKILQISQIYLPILREDQKYGGTERVVGALDREFVKLGHDSFVVAPGNSNIHGKLLVSPDESAWGNSQITHTPVRPEDYEIHIAKVLKFIADVQPDVVHDQTGKLLASQAYRRARDNFELPLLTTLHGPVATTQRAGIYESYQGRNAREFFNAISASQQSLFSSVVSVDEVIHNGVDVDNYPFVGEKEDYFLSLGRIGVEKGQREAIQVAQALDAKLIIAGPIPPHHEDYFKEHVGPHIDGKQIVFVGELTEDEKKPYFAKAKAFLNPISWEEPFGLVMTEALACGTPVVTFGRGAAPEIVHDGVTGFVVRDLESMIESARNVGDINPRACRDAVELNFSTGRQAERYLNLYGRMIASMH